MMIEKRNSMNILDLDKSKFTPMMQQYIDIKQNYMDTILFYRLGDFYEMFFEDAFTASRELEIVLTGRDAGQPERVPMCGIPFHAYTGYAEKLVAKGYKVAIVEQVEEASLAKGIVKRDVVKILTPGTMTIGNMDSKQNLYLAALLEQKREFILAFADVSTGETYLTVFDTFAELLNELLVLNIKEIVCQTSLSKKIADQLQKNDQFLLSFEDNYEFPTQFRELIQGLANQEETQVVALLINYILKTQKQEVNHLKQIIRYESDQYLKIDMFSKRNLELVETLRTGQKNGSLLNLLDKCSTALGSRMLRRWIDKPLIHLEEIMKRHNLIEIFIDRYVIRKEIEQALKAVYDLERIVGRISCGNANGRDLIQLRRSLGNIPMIKNCLSQIESSAIQELNDQINPLTELLNLLERALLDEQPLTIKEGNIFQPPFHPELLELIGIKNNSKEWIIQYEQEQRAKTGIKNLKIGYNRVFGYYIEVTKSNLDNINLEGYERRQTLANAERYISPELKHYESVVLTASDRIVNLEYELFLELRDQVSSYRKELQHLADQIASLDCIINFATISLTNHYVRPTFNQERYAAVMDGRHPVIEQILNDEFVKNDVIINKFNTLLITGPNMSGKSTYMRMYAMIVIMAQIGCFVPAKTAVLPIYDKIFTRIGASDDLVGGQSTFMVEMQEANYAISNATKDSLILFDEIGRGTATFDGLALAQAIVEYIHEKIGCTTFFSTHYHELVQLENSLSRLKNVHVAAKEEQDKVVFLHKVLDGPIDKSYGINVAALAKLPRSLIERSKMILAELETNNHAHQIDLNLFTFEDEVEEEGPSVGDEIVKELHLLDVNYLTPMECMNILLNLKKKIES